MAKNVLRYFGGYKFDDPSNPTFTKERLHHQKLVEGLVDSGFNQPGDIVERYLVEMRYKNPEGHRLEYCSPDREYDDPIVKLHSVYINGVKIEDKESLEEYEKEYGYYGDKHLNSEDFYILYVDFFMNEINIPTSDMLVDRDKSVLHKYGEAYFDKKCIRRPLLVYDIDKNYDLVPRCNSGCGFYNTIDNSVSQYGYMNKSERYNSYYSGSSSFVDCNKFDGEQIIQLKNYFNPFFIDYETNEERRKQAYRWGKNFVERCKNYRENYSPRITIDDPTGDDELPNK